MAQHSISRNNVSTVAALAIAQAAIAKAEELGIAINVSVVDSSATEIAFLRMNRAFLPSIGIAKDKAYTAAGFGFPTIVWKDALAGNVQLQAGIVRRPRVITFGGGVPIVENDEIIGAVGVSGGSEEEDIACAEAGINILKSLN